MKKIQFKVITMLLLVFFVNIYCSAQSNDSLKNQEQLVEKVLTPEERAKLSPDQILRQLIEGNERFRTNNSTKRDHSAQIRNSAVGQYPKAVVLSCLDSRVPVEDVFDQGLGDVFVGDRKSVV